MKIAVFYGEKGDSNIDMSNPYNGNPGIGGIDFRLWMMPYYLLKKYPDVEIISYLVEERNYPEELHATVVSDFHHAILEAQKEKVDVFLCRSLQFMNFYGFLNHANLNVVLTAGNFISPLEEKAIYACNGIKKVVCVGKQQYQMMMDTSIFDRATYIFNSLDCKLYEPDLISKKENIVAYMGGIYPTKGFHILARNWKHILKFVPDAKLYVIGSGKLYSKNAKLGKYGIAEKEYEAKFMKYLTDENGNIIEGVKFFGTLGGDEKLDVMRKAKVGIVNPSGETETFCYSAIEFEALGVPVVTKASNGLYDTVANWKTGLLYKTDLGLIKNIVNMLCDNVLQKRYSNASVNFIRKYFEIDNIVNQWYSLFKEISRGNYHYNDKNEESISRHNMIPVRKINKIMRDKLGMNNIPALSDLIIKRYY